MQVEDKTKTKDKGSSVYVIVDTTVEVCRNIRVTSPRSASFLVVMAAVAMFSDIESSKKIDVDDSLCCVSNKYA